MSSRPRTLPCCPSASVLCLVACAISTLAAQRENLQPAQRDPASFKRLSLEELSQIEVTSPAKEPQPAFRVPMAIHVLTAEEIRRSAAASIPEVLRLAPGVEVARIDNNKWSIGIRGFGSRLARSVLVLIDGRTVYTTFFAGTYWEVQDTVLEDIDRIEIIRGPGGTIWGPNAVNGVINIITKHSKDTQGFFATAIGLPSSRGQLQARTEAATDAISPGAASRPAFVSTGPKVRTSASSSRATSISRRPGRVSG